VTHQDIQLARLKQAQASEAEREREQDRLRPGLFMAQAGYRAHQQHAPTMDEAEASRPDYTRVRGPEHPGFAQFQGASWPELGQGPPPGVLAATARAH
jgi:hypothetical protein